MLKSIPKMLDMVVAWVCHTCFLIVYSPCVDGCLPAWWKDIPGEINKKSGNLIVENHFALCVEDYNLYWGQLFYFQSFFIDMFFSESFCMTYGVNTKR